MHFVIMGAGALGILLAAHLSRAGHEVLLVARGARARALAEGGLQVRGLADFRARCDITDDPTSPSHTDVFINTVKTHDSAAALASLTRLTPRVAFSVQNGVVKEAELIARFGAANVLGAMADFSGELEDDDAVLFTRNINLHLGELQGEPSARGTELAAAIHAAGINARAVTDIQSVIWSKFTGWVALFLMSVLTRRYTGQYLSDPDVAQVVAQIVRETALLPRSLGIPLQDISPMPVLGITETGAADAVTQVMAVGERMHANAPLHRLSALQDLLRGKRLELDQTVGYACREGARLGLDQPVLNTCHRIAAGINHGLG